MQQKKKALLNISRKTFIEVTVLLAALLLVSIVLTYVVPRGSFGLLPDGQPDYLSYTRRNDLSGIPVWKGLLAPVLVFFSSDGLTLAVLSVFLLVISASFQVMEDAGGIRALVGAVARRFGGRRRLLLVLLAFLFYCFGAFLGLFEEMLTMLPIIVSLCVLLGYDAFTGFLCCILACGMGFATAITNPFTVLLASEIIGVSPMVNIWFRLIIFAVVFLLLLAYILLYASRTAKMPAASPQEAFAEAEDPVRERRTRRIYAFFLTAALLVIVAASVLPPLQGLAVPVLAVYFLVFGILAGRAATGSLRQVLRSFGHGFVSALPTIVFIALSGSIKYVFEQGSILPTIAHSITAAASGHSAFAVALMIYLIVLVLEFFISSSTAKAILVMGILTVVQVGLSKEMLVLIYTFADGYTNMLFPTSPVLLISLSMIEKDYFIWLKRSWPLFLANTLLVVLFLAVGIAVGY